MSTLTVKKKKKKSDKAMNTFFCTCIKWLKIIKVGTKKMKW